MNILVLCIALVLTTQAKLYQVVSLTRHGARYHVNDFGDGNDTRPLWGQLTAVGMRQHQRLGLLFRKEYIDNLKFLSFNYNSSQIEVYSTPTNRTMMSIQSQLFGLYPLGTGPRLTFVNKSYHIPPYSNKSDIPQQNYAVPNAYQPIKIKQNQKIMLTDCPNYQKYQKQNFQKNADQVNEMNQTYYPFFKKLSPMYNFSLANVTLYTMLRVLDCVNVDQYLGRPLPKNFTDDDYKNLLHLANWYYYTAELGNNTVMINTQKIQKIISVFDMRTRLPDSYALKWTFLSGHDTDIIAMHLGLNLSSPSCIEEVYRKGSTSALNCEDGANFFASNIIFELHSEDAIAFTVKIRSNGKYVKLCGKNSIECDYTQWKNAAKKNIATNLQSICGKAIKTYPEFSPVTSHSIKDPFLSQI